LQDGLAPPPHYVIPGSNLELIDVIKANLNPAEYQAVCWASLMQYAYRWNKKGDAMSDLRKMLTYGNWLMKSVAEHGVCMGRKDEQLPG